MGGDVAAHIPFRQVWCCDFEFHPRPGEPPLPVCMVAHELYSGRELRLWRDDLLALRNAPFDTGTNTAFVAYYASAELGCFLELGWSLPVNVVDLYAEHRVETNGRLPPFHNSLVNALRIRGLSHLAAAEKDARRQLVIEQTSWSATEQVDILDYCAMDVTALAELLPRMAPRIDWPRALLRGRYMAAVARMERTGIPIDRDLYETLAAEWDGIKGKLVQAVDADFGVFDGTTFKSDRFGRWLADRRLLWPRHPSGALQLGDDTFRERARCYPQIGPLHELRVTLSRLRLTGLEVGSDGRNRCMLSAFSAATGRNQPSTSKFAFGPARWIRGLIRPPEGYGIAYIDFSSQEIAIAAALSGDEQMMDGYASGDPYLSFAKAAKLVPEDATKASHQVERDRCKAVVLGVNYGMGAEALASSVGITPAEARELLRLHERTYKRFWRWSEDTVNSALLSRRQSSVFGWNRHLSGEVNERSVMNFPMQANGAEMMRIAAVAGTEAGIEVCAPVHDAFLIAAPLERLEQDVAGMSWLMTRAGRAVTGGFEVRTEAEIVRWPDRYMDPRGAAMWERVMGLMPSKLRAAA